ncbi:hypothetical protein [Candidatus Aeolococcus gillhamiae]|uniref:hypothetical protein n=1 Tax=Candidatus Aeolococcus gillhamiae TaxID=3127015 RepID=UPI003076BF96
MLTTVNRMTFGTPTVQAAIELSEQPSELPLVVEGSNDLVATLATPDIVGIAAHDIPLDTIVIGVDGSHDAKCASRMLGRRRPGAGQHLPTTLKQRPRPRHRPARQFG